VAKLPFQEHIYRRHSHVMQRSSKTLPEVSVLPESAVTADELTEFVRHYPRLFVLTGAGISNVSGIPIYRDEAGRFRRG
jgi:hypothetical protein